MIWALTNPVRRGSTQHSPIDPDLPVPVRQGVALTQIIEAVGAHWLPTHGGVGATVVVTMTLDQLLADLAAAGVCSLDTGGTITAAEARRLACRAGIIPVVLGGRSVVLDAGQKTRFHTEQMRLALGLRDKTCTAEHCDVPAAMCHAPCRTARSATTAGREHRILEILRARLELGHLLEGTLDAHRVRPEVDGHPARIGPRHATQPVRVVGNQVLDFEVLDDRLGIWREGAAGEVSTPRPG